MPRMYGLKHAQFKVLDKKIEEGAGSLLRKCSFGKQPDDADPNDIYIKNMLKKIENDYL